MEQAHSGGPQGDWGKEPRPVIVCFYKRGDKITMIQNIELKTNKETLGFG